MIKDPCIYSDVVSAAPFVVVSSYNPLSELGEIFIYIIIEDVTV